MLSKSLEYIETVRLTGERLSRIHFEFIHAMHQDEQVMCHLGGLRSGEQTQVYFERNLLHWEGHGFGIWVLKDKASDSYAGRGGLRCTDFFGQPEIEIAYGLIPAFWGKGLATEFTRALLEIARDTLSLRSVVSITTPENLGSSHVLEKCGFVRQEELMHDDRTHVLFRTML